MDSEIKKRDFFISYNKSDTAWAKWIAVCLEEQGYTTWLQAWDIRPGDDFIAKMDEFLKCSQAFIAVISEGYINSSYCKLELSAALNAKIVDSTYSFVPVRIADVVLPDLIRTVVYIDIFAISEAEAEKRLLNAVAINPIPRSRLLFPAIKAKQRYANFPGLPMNNLPERNIHFSGRVEILNTINAAFKKSGAVCIKQAVSGLGGIGKTQLVLEYAYRFGHEYYDAIWWIDADTSLRKDILKFAEKCGLIPEGLEAALQLEDEDLIRRLNNWFDSHNSFLLIFDNVESLEDVQFYISNLNNGHVLITTRNKHISMGTMVDITVFLPNEASTFLRERLSCEKDEDIEVLAERLGYLPLALEQAAAYMKANNESCKSYLNLLEKYNLEVFDQHYAKAHDYTSTINTTWQISFKKIKLESARQLLNICSYFAPDEIPIDMLIEGRNELPNPLQMVLADRLSLNESVFELKQYSLLHEKDGFLYLHRLVQESMRQKLAGNTMWLSCCLNIVYHGFDYEYGNIQSMSVFSRNVPHILKIAHNAELLLNDENSQNKTAELYYKAGVGFYYSGKFEEALMWYEKSLSIREKIFGKEHPDTAAVYNNIALVCDNQGDYKKALEWYLKALAIREKMLGIEHPDTAATFDNIAMIYSQMSDYDKALEWYKKSLSIREKIFGNEHPDTATTYDNVAAVYSSLGKYDKALELYQNSLFIREKILGREHPDTAATYNNIAYIYSNQGDFTVALEWIQKALAIREKILGREHPATAMTYNNVAGVYHAQGDYDKALEWYKRALIIYEKILGMEHPSTAITYQNIGEIYYLQKKCAEAMHYLMKASYALENKLGIGHPTTQNTVQLLNKLYSFLAPKASLDEQKCIAETVVKLKEKVDYIQNTILKFDWTKQGAVVCHYTKLNVLPHLLITTSEKKDPPRLRLSNMGHLNDPTEGQYLFELLDKNSENEKSHAFRNLFRTHANKIDDSREELPLSDVYIGSFTMSIDKLPLWTLYGDDSKGCCLIFSKDYFSSQNLYRVHYVTKTAEEKTIDDIGMIKAINQIAQLLTPQIRNMENNIQLRYEVLRILDEIRFLFKCEDYEFEDEVRLIIRADDKYNMPQVDRTGDGIPRLFLNVDGDILYDEIILGAKVINPSTVVPFIKNANVPKVSISGIEYR